VEVDRERENNSGKKLIKIKSEINEIKIGKQ
jgi:hypothetical protein